MLYVYVLFNGFFISWWKLHNYILFEKQQNKLNNFKKILNNFGKTSGITSEKQKSKNYKPKHNI